MKFDYKVKYKGKWYLPGEEIPEETAYTKTEINRMSTADLQKLAAEHGVSGADETTGGELKKILIEKFEL